MTSTDADLKIFVSDGITPAAISYNKFKVDNQLTLGMAKGFEMHL